MPIEVQTAGALPREERKRTPLRSISLGPQRIRGTDRMFLTERLALLLETGNPLHSSLEVIEKQLDHPLLREVVADLRECVSGGLSFSQALAKHPSVFPPTYVNLVAAGEKGGFLYQVLQRLREMDAKREELRATLFSAFSYPAFLIVFSFAVVVFVLLVVFPKFGELFTLIWAQLPLSTRFLMVASQVLRQHAALALGGIAAGVLLLWRWYAKAGGAAALGRLAVRAPGLREIVIQFQLVQFMYVMSLSLEKGVPMLDALRACREIVGEGPFRDLVQVLEQRVNEGRGIASGFQEAEFVPPLARHMIATGEEAGGLAMVMQRMAEFYEREWKKRLATLARVIEPAMLLVMGVVIGLIVSSLILPIFKLSTTVR